MNIRILGIKLIALKINSYIKAEPITLVIVAYSNVLIFSSGVCPTKAFPLFFLSNNSWPLDQ